MSLPKSAPQPLLFSASNLLSDCFQEADPYRLFHEQVYPKIVGARDQLVGCYCQDNGRPAREPVLLMGITLLQYMEKLPDRQAMQMLKYHLGWKYALGQEVTLEQLDASLLTYFRRRLLEHGKSRMLFDTILSALVNAGLVSRRGKRRLDSTHDMGLLAGLSEAEKLQETMRLALECLQKNDVTMPSWSEAMVLRYVQSRPDWRMDKDQAKCYCQRLGGDLHVLLHWLREHHPDDLKCRPLDLLERVYAESFVMKEGTLEFTGPVMGALVNPHEPEAVMGRKRDTKWRGYKAQLSESVPEQRCAQGEPTGGFITAVQIQGASDPDIRALPQIRETEKSGGLDGAEQRFVDSAYVSGAELREEKRAGGELMGEMQAKPEHPAKAEGFVISADGRQATCPMGHANQSCVLCWEADRKAQYHRLVWRKACRNCLRRQSCAGRVGYRYVETRIDYDLLHERREQQKTPEFKWQMRQRNGIEGTISELVRAHGLRRTRYRGRARTTLWLWTIAAACNVKRWLRRALWERQAQLAIA